MNPSPLQQLEHAILRLEGTGLPREAASIHAGALHQMHAVTLRSLGRFWTEPHTPQEALGGAVARMIHGLHGVGAAWGVLAQTRDGITTLHWLVSGGEEAAHSLAAMAQSALPGSLWEAGPHGMSLMQHTQHQAAAALIGSHPAEAGPRDACVINLGRIARAMHGTNWSYLLLAQPVAPELIQQEISGLLQLDEQTRRTWMRRGSAEETNHPRARQLLHLLGGEHTRLLEGASSGLWEVQACLMADTDLHLAAGAMSLQGEVAAAPTSLRTWAMVPCMVERGRATALTRLTTGDAAALVPLPFEDGAGTPVRERVPFAAHGASVPDEPALSLGPVLADGTATRSWLQVSLRDFNRHMLICGSTRSGKSQTAQYLLRQLHEEHGLPFLVLDPAKSDYRRLLHSPLGSSLRIYTPGLPDGVPFCFNPLAVPAGVPVHLHMDGVRDLLLAAFGWADPMPSVLTLALEITYRTKGWDMNTGTHPRGWRPESMPRLRDLIVMIPQVVEKLGWKGEAANTLRTGPVTRLESLLTGPRMKVLDTTHSMDMHALLSRPAIIEMGWFGTDDDKAFLLGGLILALAGIRHVEGSSSMLRHALLIEEAHCLLAAPSSSGGHERAQPREKAVQQFCSMLATIGGYGQAIVIAEQVPTKLAPDMLANTGVKIAHQLALEQDCAAVGSAMKLTDAQRRCLPSLRPGEAVAYRAGDDGAYRLQMPDHAGSLGYAGLHVTNAAVRAHMNAFTT